MPISHQRLRLFEKGFPHLVYYKGLPFVPWRDLQAKVGKPRGWDHFQGHFRDHIIVGDNDEMTYKPNTHIYGEGNRTFLNLEDVLQEGHMHRAASSLRNDWENGTLQEDVTGNPDRPYVVHRRPNVNGVIYEPPDRHGVGGVYVLHCGSTSDGSDFILKVGRSNDILRRLHQHQQTSSNLRIHGEVEFLFGVEIDTCDQVLAESLLKVMLTEFGFSHVIVNSNGERSTETFSFNEKTLPLIHDVVCGIRYVYDPPIDRLVPDHENSVENPLYEQGLPRQLRTPIQPHPQKLMKFLSEIGPGWNTSSEWRGER
ncbi:hypothetical protein P3T76_011184 [Phytophthora citrophthora]|uniref:Bacteriophage T5 Orf172 DNA-binding domain-containing protein n=1 Tax=Phytophthora citrophthora TaxID=4793 RepID=A0AAD9GA29_9STRA|nr:hypothetical protein P3T76_011184 [Phytophthora citrophthora]